ncbi:MAG: hypothetical protein ACK5NT_13180 [Pyrinomonadaceae bacterium]
MKYSALLILLFSLTHASFSQVRNEPENGKGNAVSTVDEASELENAINQSLPSVRIEKLNAFIEKYPESENLVRAQEMLSGARAEFGDEKLRFGKTEEAIAMFKLAASELPSVISDKFFSALLIKYPANLLYRGQKQAALDVAKIIAEKVDGNTNQMLGVATFYLTAERADEALNLANRVIETNPESATAYHTKGFALRLNFDIDGAAKAFQKALEFEPDLLPAKISLAEMRRAMGEPFVAEALYKEVLSADPENKPAKAGLTITHFDTGDPLVAESELIENMKADPTNFKLMTDAAFWYAAHNENTMAIEMSQRAIAVQPRYVWSYISLAKGYLGKDDPENAEKALVIATSYGNFPTLQYFLALTLYRAGFFKEAAEALKTSFKYKNGEISAELGWRVKRSSKDFADLLAPERRASIFQFDGVADKNANSVTLLLAFESALDENDTTEIEATAERFANGVDAMRAFRNLYAAERLLDKKVAPEKAIELAQNAVSGVEDSLKVANPSAAVLSEELYQSRKAARLQNQLLIVPQISNETVIKIIRGRIEELKGRANMQRADFAQAKADMNLALTVLPAESVWKREAHWNLGVILESEGTLEAALEQYLLGYRKEDQDEQKKEVIAGLYKQIYGDLNGLEDRFNAKKVEESSSVFLRKKMKPADEERNAETTSETVAQPERTPSKTPAPSKEPSLNSEEIAEDEKVGVEASEIDTSPKTPETESAETKEVSETAKNEETEVAIDVSVKTEKPAETPANSELKTEAKEKNQTLNEKQHKTEAENKDRPIFNPIIINVPRPQIVVSNAPPTEGKVITAEKKETKTIETEKTNNDVPMPPCKFEFDKNEISLIKNGGDIDLIVKVVDGLISDVSAVSESPKNVQITRSQSSEKNPHVAAYIVRSISGETGLFTVTFKAPCGKHAVLVRVR